MKPSIRGMTSLSNSLLKLWTMGIREKHSWRPPSLASTTIRSTSCNIITQRQSGLGIEKVYKVCMSKTYRLHFRTTTFHLWRYPAESSPASQAIMSLCSRQPSMPHFFISPNLCTRSVTSDRSIMRRAVACSPLTLVISSIVTDDGPEDRISVM